MEPNTEQVTASAPVSVIDIGATSLRMLVAQVDQHGGLRTIESLSQPISLGTDTFTKGFIRPETAEDCVRALKKFCKVLNEYRISGPDQLRVLATSAVREARNRYFFLDRVKIATGLDAEVIDESEVNRFTYLSMQPLFESIPDVQGVKTLILEVGGGSTELLAVRDGNVMYSQSFRLGSLRLRQMLESFRAPLPRQREVIEVHIGQIVEEIKAGVTSDENLCVVGMGGDLRFVADRVSPLADWDKVGHLPVARLAEFTGEILEHSVDDLVSTYHITFPEAETLGPALLSYLRLAQALNLKEILVASSSMRDGVLNEMVCDRAWRGGLADQILHSAVNLGRKYHFDQPHCEHVAALSVQLFRELQEEHQLSSRHELILHVAALLHEIGLFVSNHSHHKHSMYLIRNSTLFGIGSREQLVAALIARYHRKALPSPLHEGYNQLDQDSRIAMLKLAALLRVADALDRGHAQRVRNIRIAKEEGRVTILVADVADLTLEQLALRGKDELFREVYGMEVACRLAARDAASHDAGT